MMSGVLNNPKWGKMNKKRLVEGCSGKIQGEQKPHMNPHHTRSLDFSRSKWVFLNYVPVSTDWLEDGRSRLWVVHPRRPVHLVPYCLMAGGWKGDPSSQENYWVQVYNYFLFLLSNCFSDSLQQFIFPLVYELHLVFSFFKFANWGKKKNGTALYTYSF